MALYSFTKAKFVTTAVNPKGYPTLRDPSGNIMPEIAVAGRSNVGKSSLLNHLFKSKGLVKTSSIPGKTQHINFFSVDDKLAFVDLPGYGYAQVPLKVRQQWGPMVQNYLEKRESLKLILFLFDIRRMPNDDDLALLDWIQHYHKNMVLVLTKVDKVTQNEKRVNTEKILRALNLQNVYNIHYSVTKDVGRKELIRLILNYIVPEETTDPI